jgi:hypothetical protein
MLKSPKQKKIRNVKEDPEPEADECGWMEISYHCRVPLNDSENMPAGCNPKCPARLQVLRDARIRQKENMRLYN